MYISFLKVYFFSLATGNTSVMFPNAVEVYIPSKKLYDTFKKIFPHCLFLFLENFHEEQVGKWLPLKIKQIVKIQIMPSLNPTKVSEHCIGNRKEKNPNCMNAGMQLFYETSGWTAIK